MRFRDLTEAQMMALAIATEEEDSRIFRDFAEAFRAEYPSTSELFLKMADEENEHRQKLIDAYQSRFGEHIPFIRKQDVEGFLKRKKTVYNPNISPTKAKEEAAMMEFEARNFYETAASRTNDASLRRLFGDLAHEEVYHQKKLNELTKQQLRSGEEAIEKETERRLFILRFVQPGLAGLMDGSVSTLAPLFAAAFATGDTMDTFKVGLAASIGAGISMGFAEALSDDGKLSGRGAPALRGFSCGLMTVIGGLGHTLPYLIPDFHLATTVAIIIVIAELLIIAWIRKKYMDTPLLSAIFQVVVGGILVFLVGWLIGVG